MKDQFNREIEYMRISVTDRCNLRCRYCMPAAGVMMESHREILTYEEILRLSRIAVSLGISRFKITGGEPLLRRGCLDFIARLKAMPGVREVTLTTNGLLLAQAYDALAGCGIDGINVSLDSLQEERYQQLTGGSAVPAAELLDVLKQGQTRGFKMKINTVLLRDTRDEIPAIAQLSADPGIDVRFIELMPIGEGGRMTGVTLDEARDLLIRRWPDLQPDSRRRGNGPARYWSRPGITGSIGFISAMSEVFCGDCNRVRLTCTGMLKPCLCYDQGIDLKALLRGEASDEALLTAMRDCIYHKPQAHSFNEMSEITEQKSMHRIGG